MFSVCYFIIFNKNFYLIKKETNSLKLILLYINLNNIIIKKTIFYIIIIDKFNLESLLLKRSTLLYSSNSYILINSFERLIIFSKFCRY